MRKILPILIFALIGVLLIKWLPVDAKNMKIYQSSESDAGSPALQLVDAEVTLAVNQPFDATQYILEAQYDTLQLPIINTAQVGSQLAIYKAKKNLESITKVLTINIKDDQKPVFLQQADTLVTDYQTEIDFNQYFSGQDEQSEVTLRFVGGYDLSVAQDYPITAILTDASGNQVQHDFILTVKAEEKSPEVEVSQVTENLESTSATTTSQGNSNSFNARLTHYGMDCYGCNNYNGIGYTSTGIALSAHAIRQPDGSWQEGLTYNGRFIFASSSSHLRCTLITVYNHGYSGMEISPDEPIYGVIADVGALDYHHLDLFIGSEKGTIPVSVVDWETQPYFIITGYGKYTGSGCSF